MNVEYKNRVYQAAKAFVRSLSESSVLEDNSFIFEDRESNNTAEHRVKLNARIISLEFEVDREKVLQDIANEIEELLILKRGGYDHDG